MHDDLEELTKEFFVVNYHDIRKRARQLLKSNVEEGAPSMIVQWTLINFTGEEGS